MRTSSGQPAIDRAAGLRAVLVGAAGLVIFLISLAAAFLPRVPVEKAAFVVGAMMVVAGSVEMLAGIVRRSNGLLFMLPGAATVAAGSLFAMEPFNLFIPMVWLVIGWLGLRGSVLVLAGFEARRSIRLWTFASAGTDLALGALLLGELSASMLPMTLFGVTSEIMHGFAIIVAISFVTTAMLLMEVAAFESDSESDATNG